MDAGKRLYMNPRGRRRLWDKQLSESTCMTEMKRGGAGSQWWRWRAKKPPGAYVVIPKSVPQRSAVDDCLVSPPEKSSAVLTPRKHAEECMCAPACLSTTIGPDIGGWGCWL